MDIFEKCERYTVVKDIREKGLYPYFHELQSRQDVEVVMEGKRRIMLGSNNYLGLTTNPEVIEAGIKAYEQYGSGCSGSRFLNGTLALHVELEKELSEFLRKEDVVTFSTGFQSNLGIISAIVGRGNYVICDKETMPAFMTDAGSATENAPIQSRRHGASRRNNIVGAERCGNTYSHGRRIQYGRRYC